MDEALAVGSISYVNKCKLLITFTKISRTKSYKFYYAVFLDILTFDFWRKL
jgi:hypothetical protein